VLVSRLLGAGDAAVPYRAITPEVVHDLQRRCGNAHVSRYLIARQLTEGRKPSRPAIETDGRCVTAGGGRPLARQPAEAVAPALPDSSWALARIGDFSGYSEDARMAAVETILEDRWVGPFDEGTLERIWSSFGDDLVDVAGRNLELFEQSAERGAELLDLPQLKRLRARFRHDVIGLAHQHLVDNRAYVTAQLELLGLHPGGADENPELAAIQRDAADVSRAQEAQRELRRLQVGYEYPLDHPGVGVSTTLVASFFDPDQPPLFGPNGNEQPALASWQAAKEQYDRLAALIAGVANQNPAIYAAIRGGTTPDLATADPQDALKIVRAGLTQVLADIDAADPKIASGRLDYRDLKPIHEQLFAGERSVSGEDWSTGVAAWVGRDIVRDHEATEFWITLGLSSLAAAAFVVATLATVGSATFFIAAGLGAGIGIGQAAVSWDKYAMLAQAARTNVRDDLGLLSSGQASGALVQAVLDTAFVFLDVFAAAGRLARAGGQTGRVLTREAAEQAEREVAELARRQAAELAEERAAASAGREILEAAGAQLDDVPVKIGTSDHFLKVLRYGDRVRVWLCTDCALLVDRVGAAIDAIPAGAAHDPLRTELREIMATAQRFEDMFNGLPPGPQIHLPRLNWETNALATRLAELSRTHPDIEALIFFRTFMADAEGAARVLGGAVARRLEDELGREGLVQLMRDIGPEALRNLSDLPGVELSRMLEWVRGAIGDDANRVLRWLGESRTGAEAARLLSDLSPETVRRLVMVGQRNRITAEELAQLVDQLGAGTIKQLDPMLGAQFTGRRLQELQRMEMFVLDPALQRLVDAGRGAVARSLRPLRNRLVADIEDELMAAGMRGPRAIRGMRVWTHADGSVVRIKTGAEALRGPTKTPHVVREIAEGKHRWETTDIIAKVTEEGRLVSAGTNWARVELSGWFRGLTARVPTDAELTVLLDIWGRAGHVPVIR
jgi:hypothetical protein